MFICPICSAEFKDKRNHARHVSEVHNKKKFNCSSCNASYSRNARLKNHVKNKHEVKNSDGGLPQHDGIVQVDPPLARTSSSKRARSEVLTTEADDNECSQLRKKRKTEYECKTCRTFYPTYRERNNHFNEEHRSVPYADPLAEEETPEVFISTTEGESGNENSSKRKTDDVQAAEEDCSPPKRRNEHRCNSSACNHSTQSNIEDDIIMVRPEEDLITNLLDDSTCPICNKHFKQHHNLLRHIRTVHNSKHYLCNVCGSLFGREDHLRRHIRFHHKIVIDDWSHPNVDQPNLPNPAQDINASNPVVQEVPQDQPHEQDPKVSKEEEEIVGEFDADEAFDGLVSVKTYEIVNREMDMPLFLNGTKKYIIEDLQQALKEKGPLKFYISVQVEFQKLQGDQVKVARPWFRHLMTVLVEGEDMDELLLIAFAKILKSFANYQKEGSCWQMERILMFRIHYGKYVPFAGRSFIALPKELLLKHAIQNPKNTDDDKCFIYAILMKMHHPNDHAGDIKQYAGLEKDLDTTGMDFPVPLTQIPSFERRNEKSVNVFGWENGELFPLYISKYRFANYYDLLLISEGENQHYCLISNFNRLLSSLTKHNGEAHYCRYCFHRFSTKAGHDIHVPLCSPTGAQKIKMPNEQSKWLQFNKHYMSHKIPFVMYADFECLSRKSVESNQDKDGSKSYTITQSSLETCGYSYCIIGTEGLVRDPVVYRGKDAVKSFLDAMIVEEEWILQQFANPKPIVMTDQQKAQYANARTCYLCRKELAILKRVRVRTTVNGREVFVFRNEIKDDKVRDHCHITGQYRGAAHWQCNLNYKLTKRIPVFFHNGKCFDNHLLMDEIGKYKDRKLSCIAQTMEKYISMSWGSIVFLDSIQFLNASLDSLVKNLSSDGIESFHSMKKCFNREELQMMIRKGVYPYAYMDDHARFDETILPPKEAFYNHLSETEISDEDYEHATKVWKAFNIKNMGEYHDLYVKCDVLLLADNFEIFRSLCLESYELDPAHSYTLPGFSWEAAKKMTGVRLELLTDPDMFKFFEMGKRGGVAMISKRHASANNSLLHDHDPSKPNSFLVDLDANNLYGGSMCEPLPMSGFEWLTEEQCNGLDVTQIPADSPIGYLLEVDLDYPIELHDWHSDYPLAPEKKKVDGSMLSPYSLELLGELGQKHTPFQKLVPNLNDKRKYILHHSNLKFYIEEGLILKKIHRAIKFNQAPWLRPFMELNSKLRAEATNDLKKNLFKLMNNSVFGKSIEDKRNRKNLELLTDPSKLKRIIASPTFHSFKIFNKDLVAVHRNIITLYLDKPIYTGVSILDISKITMYKFYYRYLKDKYHEKINLLFTDTDSLMVEIETDDFFEDIRKDVDEHFDTSDYHDEHKCYSVKNKKVVNMFKDETKGVPIREFVGLRPKMYSFITEKDEETKKAKGISRTAVDKRMTHALYKEALFGQKSSKVHMMRIQSKDHKLKVVEINKTGLSPFDDKRYVLQGGVKTLAHGHYQIGMEVEDDDDK